MEGCRVEADDQQRHAADRRHQQPTARRQFDTGQDRPPFVCAATTAVALQPPTDYRLGLTPRLPQPLVRPRSWHLHGIRRGPRLPIVQRVRTARDRSGDDTVLTSHTLPNAQARPASRSAAVRRIRRQRPPATAPGPRAAADHHRALFARVQSFVWAHLGDPELRPDTIAAAHHISTRSLHRLFRSQGCTVSSWIRRQRLNRARRDLADPKLAHHTIQTIAATWGFTRAADFTRAFRTAYGVPPQDFRTGALRADHDLGTP
ncbi:helix-turn-helix domain-containing protein [Streptomyces sp. RK75]|nr:helix-turn-helix domain-containing protein [Streptomyces sp. RK75]